jgi:hypothetical protein
MIELVLVRYFQPASIKGFEKYNLDGLYDHPARYVECVCWFDNSDFTIQSVGGVGRFDVKIDTNFNANQELVCSNFLGEFNARIISRYLPKEKMMDSDNYILAD